MTYRKQTLSEDTTGSQLVQRSQLHSALESIGECEEVADKDFDVTIRCKRKTISQDFGEGLYPDDAGRKDSEFSDVAVIERRAYSETSADFHKHVTRQERLLQESMDMSETSRRSRARTRSDSNEGILASSPVKAGNMLSASEHSPKCEVVSRHLASYDSTFSTGSKENEKLPTAFATNADLYTIADSDGNIDSKCPAKADESSSQRNQGSRMGPQEEGASNTTADRQPEQLVPGHNEVLYESIITKTEAKLEDSGASRSFYSSLSPARMKSHVAGIAGKGIEMTKKHLENSYVENDEGGKTKEDRCQTASFDFGVYGDPPSKQTSQEFTSNDMRVKKEGKSLGQETQNGLMNDAGDKAVSFF